MNCVFQGAPGTHPSALLGIQPASLWDAQVKEWCQQIKSISQDLREEEPDTTPGAANQENPHASAAHKAELPGEAGDKAGNQAKDDFTFDMSAFEPKAPSSKYPKVQNDPFAFDANAFGIGFNEPPQEDPYAFDPSQFGQEPAQGAEEKQQQTGKHKADPYAFDAEAFGMDAAVPEAKDPYAFDPSQFDQQPMPETEDKPQSSAQPSADPFAFNASASEDGGKPGTSADLRSEDPFTFNMEAFQDPQPQTEDDNEGKIEGDRYAFNKDAFEGPRQQARADEDLPMKSAGVSQPQQANKQQQGSGTIDQGPKLEQKSNWQPKQTSQSGKTLSVKVDAFRRAPREAFTAMTPSELSKLRQQLQQRSKAPEEKSGSSDDEDEPDVKPGVSELSRETAEEVVRIAQAVTSGSAGSLADASVLDNAAQHAASSIQACI